jgi:hypothetical protein
VLGELFPRGLHLLVQEVGSPARAHLDIETDNIGGCVVDEAAMALMSAGSGRPRSGR